MTLATLILLAAAIGTLAITAVIVRRAERVDRLLRE